MISGLDALALLQLFRLHRIQSAADAGSRVNLELVAVFDFGMSEPDILLSLTVAQDGEQLLELRFLRTLAIDGPAVFLKFAQQRRELVCDYPFFD